MGELTVRDAPAGPLHVLVIIDSLTAGGAEMLLADFATGASAIGLRTSVAYLAERDGSPAATRLRRLGIEPIKIDYRGFFHPSTLVATRRHIGKIAPDIVHTHLDYADTFGGLAARSLAIPSVSTVHVMEWTSEGVRDKVRARAFRFARQHSAAAVVAVSDASKAAIISAGLARPDHLVTIRNGVDAVPQPGAGRAVRAELGIEPDELVVTQIAVLRQGKGHEVTAEAVKGIEDRIPNTRLLVVGDGPDRESVAAAIAPLGPRALALGHRDDVMAVLDASDVVVSPSVVDAFPTVLLEAMAASVPIAATAVGGIPEIVVDGETGLLLRGPAEFAEALERLLGDRALRSRLGKAGRARYEREFTAVKWASRLRHLYAEVLASESNEKPGGRH